jgi:nitrite reductase (NADH) small subunit
MKGVKACSVEDVPVGEGRAVTIAGRRIAVFRTREGWYALDNACPHLGGPLADGIVAERSVICPLHERRFDLRSGEALTDGCAVTAHRVAVLDGNVYVQLSDDAQRHAAGRSASSSRLSASSSSALRSSLRTAS